MPKAPTKAESDRMYAISYYCGCLPCLLQDNLNSQCDVHHLTSGGRRIGHSYTYGACPYHHRGVIQYADERKIKGPSMATDRRNYVERFGSDDVLLKVQDYILEQRKEVRWFENDLPVFVAESARKYWRNLRKRA